MHLMTFDSDFDLKWGHPNGQQGKISSELFADIDKPSCPLCRKSAHKSSNYLSDHQSMWFIVIIDETELIGGWL